MHVTAALTAGAARPGGRTAVLVRVDGAAAPLRVTARLVAVISLDPHSQETVAKVMGTPAVAMLAAPAPDEDIRLELELPADAPASATGLTDWTVQLQVEPAHGEAIELEAPLTVVAPIPAPRRPAPPLSGGAPCNIALEIETTTVAPGMLVGGIATVAPTAGTDARELDVTVRLIGVWQRRRPRVEHVIAESPPCRPWAEPRGAEGYDFAFALPVPADAPPSFESGMTALDWYVVAECRFLGAGDDPAWSVAVPVHVRPEDADLSAASTGCGARFALRPSAAA